MKIIIVGCGRLGSELANRLHARDNEVSIIDILPAAFQNLSPNFHGRLIEGDALNQDVLKRAGIQEADALAAVTSSDPLNLVVGHVACKLYRVPNVVARNYGSNCRVLFEIFGLQVISANSWGAQRVEEMLSRSGLHTVFSAGNGEVEIYEMPITEEWNGRKLSSLMNPLSTPVAITRAGRAFLPDPDALLQTGDVVHVSATFEGIEEIRRKVFHPDKEA